MNATDDQCLQTKLRLALAFALLALACTSKKDPCANVESGFSIHAVRVAEGIALEWTAVPADHCEIWPAKASSIPVTSVTDKSAVLLWRDDLGVVTFEIRPSINQKRCPPTYSKILISTH